MHHQGDLTLEMTTHSKMKLTGTKPQTSHIPLHDFPPDRGPQVPHYSTVSKHASCLRGRRTCLQ